MGNHDSKQHSKVGSGTDRTKPNPNKEIEQLFEALSNGSDHLSRDHLKDLFDSDLLILIFDYLSNFNEKPIDKNQFTEKIVSLLKNNSNAYFSMALYGKSEIDKKTAHDFINICCSCAGISINKNDETFLKSLITALMNYNEICQLENFKNSVENICPRILTNMQICVTTSFKERRKFVCNASNVDSKMLSKFQIWFLQCYLPIMYLNKVSLNSSYFDFNWTLLYSSNEHGLSVNRFEAKVFNYRSPTILIVKLKDSRLLVVGVDCEWRMGAHNWGDFGCFSFEMEPKCGPLESGSGLMFFNTKLRTCPIGIIIGQNKKNPVAQIDGDFSNVLDLEVWGCGSADAEISQQEQKLWERKQAEKHAKVPLSGNWEENPDKSLLEMGGVTVSHAER